LFQISRDVGLVFVFWVCGDGLDVVLGKEGSCILMVFMFVYNERCFSLSARVTIALFLLSLLCMFLAICNCRLYVLWLRNKHNTKSDI